MIKLIIALYFMLLGAFIEVFMIGLYFHFDNQNWGALLLGLLLIPLGVLIIGLFETL